MNKTFNLLFYVKKSKVNSLGEAPVYLRITIDGQRCEISTKRSVHISKWNSRAQKVVGSSEAAKSYNLYFKTFEQKVYDAYNTLLRTDDAVTCEMLKNKSMGKHERVRTLISVFKDHNDRMEKLVGIEFAKGTLTRYNTCLSHTQEFLLWKYNLSDIDIIWIKAVRLKA